MKHSWKFLSALLLLALLALPAAHAWAATAANTEIVNKAHLTYAGGFADASITVTVAIINSQANITITGNGPDAWTAANTPTLTDNIVVTATANGPADYTITPSITAQTNNGASGSFTIAGAATQTITLGASVTTASSNPALYPTDANNLVIPKPNAANFDAVNKIANGIKASTALTWSIGATNYVGTVTSVAYNGDGTVTLHFDTPLTGIPSAGTPIYEYRTLPVIVAPGSPSTPGTPITVTVSASVSDGGVGTVNTAPTPGLNTWNTSSGNGVLKKYVRNLTTSSANSTGTNAKSFSVDGKVAADYFDGGVTGVKDDLLEYILEASNTSGTDPISNSVINDVIPTAYVAYQTNKYTTGAAVSKDVWYKADTGATATLTVALSGAKSDTIAIPVGGIAPAAAGGTIPANGICLVAYQLKIN